MDLLEGLEAFFFEHAPVDRGDRLVVAFSGGGDSTALLWGLARVAPAWGVELAAAHLDHAMDPWSAGRAAQARDLARRLGVPLVSARRQAAAGQGAAGRGPQAEPAARRLRYPGPEAAARRLRYPGPEAAARRLRYQFLEEVRRRRGARYVVTAHHRDDQAETVLLRLRFGSGLRGLAGIRPVSGGGAVVRPLLGMSRAQLRAAVAAAGLRTAEDPGNADPRQPRSRMRHRVLPALAGEPAGAEELAMRRSAEGDGAQPAAGENELADLLARLAAGAQRALPILDRRLADEIGLNPAAGAGDASAGATAAGDVSAGATAGDAAADATAGDASADATGAAAADRRRLAALPPALLIPALAILHHRAGIAYPASRAAAAELRRQLSPTAAGGLPRRGRRPARVGCDCGAGWRWQASATTNLGLRRAAAPREATPPFTYTLEVPGWLTIPEIGATISVSERPVATCVACLRHGAPDRALLALPLAMPTAPGGAPSPEAASATGEPPAPASTTGPEWPPAPAGRLCLTVRNRRPGDRLRPLGSPGSRKLKAVLIDRRVPAEQRDRLPLLCWTGEIAWVPGVTIGHRFRVTGESRAWLAELTFQA